MVYIIFNHCQCNYHVYRGSKHCEDISCKNYYSFRLSVHSINVKFHSEYIDCIHWLSVMQDQMWGITSG